MPAYTRRALDFTSAKSYKFTSHGAKNSSLIIILNDMNIERIQGVSMYYDYLAFRQFGAS